MNLFKWINELFVGKRDWDSFSDADRKSFSPFMVIRYLSMSEDFLPLVNHMQNYVIEDMPHKAVYQFWCGILPKKKTYLKYIKGKKDKFSKEINWSDYTWGVGFNAETVNEAKELSLIHI